MRSGCRYRIHVRGWNPGPDPQAVTLAATTAVTTSTTRHAVRTAKFVDNTVAVGQKVTATLGVAPARHRAGNLATVERHLLRQSRVRHPVQGQRLLHVHR